jgi:two-component system sensor histidine kinase DesK
MADPAVGWLWAGVWGVGVLLPAALYLDEAPRPWVVGAALVLVLGCFCRSVVGRLSSSRGGAARLPWLLLAVQAIVTGALATFAWSQWTMVVLLLAIAVGAVVPTPWAPAVVLLVAALAVGVTRGHGALWGDTVWSTGLTVLLAGLVTHAFTRLSVTIAELQAAREELARSAVSHERLRFARDLHDLLGHSLSLIVVKAEATRRIAPADAGAAARHAADIETIGRQALDEVRSAVRGYRDAGLSEELAGARDTLGAAGVTVELPEHRVPTTAEQEALLGWVVREGTTNVLRHARARRCTITLDGDEERLRLRIVDDGVGHAAGHDVLPGSGLTGLRERLVAAGGQLETVGSPTGFSLTASLPRSDYGRTERICP